MKDACTKLTEAQIETEITASLKYLSMAAYFSRDIVNRPGFAKFFFGASSEEREHATALIGYLQMRGRYVGNMTLNIPRLVKAAGVAELGSLQLDNIESPKKPTEDKHTTSSGLAALQNALKMEKAVTASIRKLIEACENDEGFNHYHVSRT